MKRTEWVESVLDDAPSMLLIATYVATQWVLFDTGTPRPAGTPQDDDGLDHAIAYLADRFRALDRSLLAPLADAARTRLNARGIDIKLDVVYGAPPH